MAGFGMSKETIEEVGIFGGLAAVQLAFAGSSVLVSYLMSLGLDPLAIVIFSSFATFLLLSPLALYFERSKWPHQLTLKLMIQLVLLSLGGVTLFQILFLQGIKMTSPAIATAMPNLAPGFIFSIAWICRLEKVNLSCLYSKLKIVGTVLCVLGALGMGLMQSTAKAKEAMFFASSPDAIFDKEKIIGCLILISAVFILSCNVVLQAVTLAEFPAPISICAVTSLIGAFISTSVLLFQDHGFQLRLHLSVQDAIAFTVLTGIVNGVCVSFNGWALKKRGPVLVSMFSPVGTVFSVILSVFTLGDTINLLSLGGMLVMFGGLYMVLWAKGKEDFQDRFESEVDLEKPLLN